MDTYVPEQHVIESEKDADSPDETVSVSPVTSASSSLTTTYDHLIKPVAIPKRKHPVASQLPETITILKDAITDGTIYLVGTAHFRFVHLSRLPCDHLDEILF